MEDEPQSDGGLTPTAADANKDSCQRGDDSVRPIRLGRELRFYLVAGTILAAILVSVVAFVMARTMSFQLMICARLVSGLRPTGIIAHETCESPWWPVLRALALLSAPPERYITISFQVFTVVSLITGSSALLKKESDAEDDETKRQIDNITASVSLVGNDAFKVDDQDRALELGNDSRWAAREKVGFVIYLLAMFGVSFGIITCGEMLFGKDGGEPLFEGPDSKWFNMFWIILLIFVTGNMPGWIDALTDPVKTKLLDVRESLKQTIPIICAEKEKLQNQYNAKSLVTTLYPRKHTP